MAEQEISPLAKRLAEENNVDWRRLIGSGDGGKIVERDVLDYLSRVMSGEEDINPTPEPLPEGLDSWASAGVGSAQADAPSFADEPVPPAVDDPAPPAVDEPAPRQPEAPAPASSADSDIDEGIFVFDDEQEEEPPVASAGPGWDDDIADFGGAETGSTGSDFGSSDLAGDDFYGGASQGAEASGVEFDWNSPAEADRTEQQPASDLSWGDEPAADEPAWTADELAPDAPVWTADEPAAETPAWTADEPAADAPAWSADEPADAGWGAESGDSDASHAEPPSWGAAESDSIAWDSPESETPAWNEPEPEAPAWSEPEQEAPAWSEPEPEAPAWNEPEPEAPAWNEPAQAEAPSWDQPAEAEAPAWDEPADEPETPARSEAEQESEAPAWSTSEPDAPSWSEQAEPEESWTAPQEPEDPFAPAEGAALASAEWVDEEEFDSEPEPAAAGGWDEDLPDPLDQVGDEAPAGVHLEEEESKVERSFVPGTAAGVSAGAAAVAQAVATAGGSHGIVLRRQLQLSALVAAQQAVAQELELDEGAVLLAFLLRAAARAGAQWPLAAGSGELAVAHFEGDEVNLSNIADVAGMPFRELAAACASLDSSGAAGDAALVVADLSVLGLDEAVLDLGCPLLSIGRLSRRGKSGRVFGTLSLSGPATPGQGSRLLQGVADLLNSPVRLLL